MSEIRKVDPTQVIPFQEKFGYALGDFASNLFWMPFILFGTFFYTDVFGISAASVGVMLLVTRIWDTVIDPLMGAIADRTRPRKGLGRYRPYLYWFALPFGFISASAFYTPDVSQTAKLVYAWGTYTAFGVIYTIINIPYSTLMSVMSKEPSERQSTSFFRMVGAQAAGLIISTGLMFFVAKAGGVDDAMATAIKQQHLQRGWFLVMGGFAALAVVCFLLTGKMTRERVEPEIKPGGEIKKDMKSIVTCAPWWILFLASFFTIAAFTLRYGVAAYYFKYYADQKAIAEWSLYEGGAISAFFTLDKIAALVSVVVFGTFAKAIEKKTMYIVLLLASGLLSLGFNYVPNTNVTAIILIQAGFSFLTAPTGAILFAMYTDIAAHIRNESGTISNGLVMSAGSFAQKFGWAIGGSITGILLGWAGYVPDQTQTDQVKGIMSFMMSWAPMIACVIGALCMAAYPLSDKRMRKITEELAQKGLAETSAA